MRRVDRLVLVMLAFCGACLPASMDRPAAPLDPTPVRVTPRDGARSEGVLARLDADSVVWRVGSERRALALADVARVAVAERLTQGEAFRRGALRGALVGAAIGGTWLALDRDAAGWAVGLVLGGAWLGGVFGGQQADSPRPPLRWRQVHPRD